MKLFGWLQSEYFNIIESIKFWMIKRQANNLHKQTGKRYHVLARSDGKLIIVDNSFIENYNKHAKGKAKQMTVKDLLEMSYYSTSVNSPVLRERAIARR